MKRFKLFLAISTITLFTSLIGYSQEENNPLGDVERRKPIYVGPVLGYNRTYHSVDLATYNSTVPCPVFTNGDNNGFFVGGSMEYLLGVKDSKSSIIGRVLYNTFPASFSKESGEASTGGFPSLDQNGNPVYSDVLHTNEVSFSTITIEAMYKFNFMGNLGVVVGPSIDVVSLTKTQEQKMSLIKPANASFKVNTEDKTIRYTDFVSGNNNPRGIILKEGTIDGSGIRFGLKAGIQYEIITNSKMYIVPSLSYNLGLTSISSDQTWRVSAIQLGVDIRFAM